MPYAREALSLTVLMKKLTLLLLLAASAIAVSPVSYRDKAATSGTAAVAGFYVVLRNKKDKLNREEELTQKELDLAKSHRKFATELTNLAKEKSRLQDDWEAIAALRHELSLQREKGERELKAIEESLLGEAARKETSSAQSIKAARIKAARAIRRLRAKIRREKYLIVAEAEEKAKTLVDEAIALAAKEREAIETKSQRDIDEAWAEVDEERAENQKFREDLEKEVQETQAELQQLLDVTLERAIADLEAKKEREKQAELKELMVPHIQKYREKEAEVNQLISMQRMLRAELAESKDIRLCRETGLPHADRANFVLTWLKREHGIYANWYSSSIDEYGVFRLGFDLWQEDPKLLKKLGALMPLLANKLGCPEPPTIACVADESCYMLTALPRKSAAIAPSRLEDVLKRATPDQDLPEAFTGIEASLRDQIANELEYQAEETAMLAFVPPVPLKPNTHKIGAVEIQTYKHYLYYRSQATGGREPNITTKAELLWAIYGVQSGWGTHQKRDRVLQETLSERYDRVMLMLGRAQIQEGED